MGIYRPKIKTRESPRGQPKMVLLQNKGFKENPGGKAEPCPREDLRKTPVERRSLVHGRIVKESFLEKVFVSKMTHNLVFAGQPRRTATLPQNGHGAWLETCSC